MIKFELGRGRNQLKETHAMPSFRIPMSFVAAAALAAAIGAAGTLVHAHLTSNVIACSGPAIADLNGVAVKAVSPLQAAARGSTYADEVANTNHEGF
jgi:hypothetical protein